MASDEKKARSKSRASEAREAEMERHGKQGRILDIVLVCISVAFLVFVVLMLLHGTNVVLEDDNAYREFYATFEVDTDYISIETTAPIHAGTELEWEVTKGPDNETIASGTQGANDTGPIYVQLEGAGEYGVHLTPPYAGPPENYTVTVRELFVGPGTLNAVKVVSVLVLIATLVLWGYYLWPKRKKYLEQYRRTLYMTAPACMVCALAAFLVTLF